MNSAAASQRRSLVLSALFLFLIVLISGGMSVYVVSDPALSQVSRMARIAYVVDRNYMEDIDWNQATRNALNAMFAKLDRFSGYIEPRSWKRVTEEFHGSYTGLGITVMPHDDGLLIMSVRENGPAAEKGMYSGDIILAADSVPLAGREIADATEHLRGPEGTDVNLRVFRPVDRDTLDFTITRRQIDLEHIPFAGYTPDSVVYIRLLDFDAGASRDLEAALDSLLHKDSVQPRGVILDLRGNPGGLLNEGYGVANLFLDEGQLIVGTDGRSRWDEHEYRSSGRDKTGGLPLAVLVDEGSASAAEIVAGSLQQLRRASLVGDTTFGKGLVQGFTTLADGGAVRLTISRYYLDGRLYLNRFDSVLVDTGRGLIPDYPVTFPDQDPFPRDLERSLLLLRFAGAYQDEIVASGDFALDRSWVTRFKAYADSAGFVYESLSTTKLKNMNRMAGLEHSNAVQRVIGQLLALSHAEDARQIEHYGDYVVMRLKELAFERQAGSYAAYAKAIVPARPDIQYAAHLLREPR